LESTLDVWEWKIWVFLVVNPNLKSFSKCMFFVWDGNHRL
jgi:hypothetical protein